MEIGKEYDVIDIHRHIGGLEKASVWNKMPCFIHRHIGGLENLNLENNF